MGYSPWGRKESDMTERLEREREREMEMKFCQDVPPSFFLSWRGSAWVLGAGLPSGV